jgi:hypothetical protein
MRMTRPTGVTPWALTRRGLPNDLGKIGGLMGGMGSGRQGQAVRASTDDMLRLDLRTLVQKALKSPNGWSYSGTSTWTRGEMRVGQISTQVALDPATQRGVIVLAYNRSGAPIEQRIRLEAVPCNYGGVRWWARCDGCSRRIAVVYGSLFRCRQCHGLGFATSRQGKMERATTKARGIHDKLGDSGWGELFTAGAKPKGMHWRTYERHEASLRQALRAQVSAMPGPLRGMVERYGM